MINKIFLAKMCAVLTVFVGTAYMHIGTTISFAENQEPTAAETEIFVVFEEKQDREDDIDAVLDTLMDEVSIESAEEVVEAVADEGAGVLITVADSEDREAAIETLNETEGVAYAQPNFRYKMMGTAQKSVDVNDEYRDAQYYLDDWDPSFASECGADVANAWELLGGINEGGTEGTVTIAVLDSGCQVTHHDLSANLDIEHAFDAVQGKQGAEYVTDSSGHGTHVCGIAAGVANNNGGIAGASGNYAKVIPINVFTGVYSDTADMVTAFSYLEGLMDTGEVQNLHVINMSLGGYNGPDENDIALESYINRMRNKDVLTVCAGGNGDEKTGIAYKDKFVYPGDFEGCLCVTSLDSDGTNSSFSDYNMQKDISAPGSVILSTMIDSKAQLGSGVADEGYKYLNGTSMASPLVAGIAALIWADNKQLTADQVFESIVATASPVNPAAHEHTGETGSAGAIDAAKAIGFAREHFDTTRESLSDGTITVYADGLAYDGTEKKPEVKVTCGGEALKEGIDYILSYINCIDPGTATVTATGIHDYIGTISAKYTIAKADIAAAEVKLEPAQFEYDGQYHFPDITVTMHGSTLKWGQDFTPTAMSNGTDKGEHKIKLNGKGKYTGEKTVSYRIGAPSDADGNADSSTSADTELKVDTTFTAGKFTYKVISSKQTPEVSLVKTTARGSVSIPGSVKYKSSTCVVTNIGAGAFKNMKTVKSVTVPASVTTIGAKAFAGCKKLKTVTLKTKKLTAKSVKGFLSGSKVKTVKVKVGAKKDNKQFIKKYKKIFTKKNCGKKVKVR